MLRIGLRGAIAGAAGTMALDITTYGDMLVRGRGASGVPARVAGAFADELGIDALATARQEAPAEHRREAAGALLGYAAGLAIGGLYGMLRGNRGNVSMPLAGAALGIVAMIASDAPIALSGASDPRTWTPVDWASDLIPHLVYGLVTAGTYEMLAAGERQQRK